MEKAIQVKNWFTCNPNSHDSVIRCCYIEKLLTVARPAGAGPPEVEMRSLSFEFAKEATDEIAILFDKSPFDPSSTEFL
jgi:hypothetical protein